MKTEIILGPPGTGKTTTLLDYVDTALSSGVSPERIGFVSFTRRAIREAVSRASERFNISPDDFPYFRTLHSMCFRMLGISKEQIMQRKDYKIIRERFGHNFSLPIFDDDTGLMRSADEVTRLEQLSRIMLKKLREVWFNTESTVGYKELKFYTDILSTYKKYNLLYDYTDLLSGFLESNTPGPELDLLLIDEAQDLSALQWKVVDKLMENSRRSVVCGDDDQAIFEWSGADVSQFIHRGRGGKVLEQSYRLPQCILEVAQKVGSKIRGRLKKKIRPTGSGGYVDTVVGYEYMDQMDEGNWLVLVRNRHHIDRVVQFCRNMGYSYSSPGSRTAEGPIVRAAFEWEEVRKSGLPCPTDLLNKFRDLSSDCNFNVPWFEAFNRVPVDDIEFLRSVLRRGENLKRPRIRISTIHGSKGAECDNVLLLCDQSRSTGEHAELNPSSEARVFYVGITRAKKRLLLMEPQTPEYYTI